MLGRANPVHRIGPTGRAQLLELGRDLGERGVPADALVLAVDQLHRITKPIFAVAVLAQRSALRAVRTEVERRIEHRLLAHPDAVLDHRIDGTADRAMRANGSLDFNLAGPDSRRVVQGRMGLAHQRELARRQAHPDPEAGATQKGAPVHGRQRARQATAQAVHKRRRGVRTASVSQRTICFFGQQHRGVPSQVEAVR